MRLNCARMSSGAYAVTHNPAAYFTSIRGSCTRQDGPLRRAPDLSAKFAFVTPNLCNDTHDCSVSTGDLWLQSWLPLILSSPTYLSGDTAVILMWDEYTPMPNVYITPSTLPGTVSSAPFNHYSLLRTTEE